jgi:nucleotide-binding universal stress UspA family protein
MVPPTGTEHRRALEAARGQLDRAAAAAGGAAATVLLEGPPVGEVLRLVERVSADLLVVGSRGRTGLARVALGSVAEELVSLAPCPVLTVRLQPSAP